MMLISVPLWNNRKTLFSIAIKNDFDMISLVLGLLDGLNEDFSCIQDKASSLFLISIAVWTSPVLGWSVLSCCKLSDFPEEFCIENLVVYDIIIVLCGSQTCLRMIFLNNYYVVPLTYYGLDSSI